VIRTAGLKKSFGGVCAVDGLDFLAEDGVVTGLVGANGAGKTTTFRALCGVVRPDEGSATVDGFDAWSERMEVLPRLGVLPDIRGLYPRLTPREHLLYFGDLHGIARPVLMRRIDALADRLEMTGFVDRRARGLSRGQELKVALARALVHEPRNVIFDEPTNGLDVASARAVRALIRELRDDGRCVVLASHVMPEVAQLCDRICVIDRGRAIAAGPPERLLTEYGVADLEELFVRLIGRGADRNAGRQAA
jgi:sodium transport system ATP-binding protein